MPAPQPVQIQHGSAYLMGDLARAAGAAQFQLNERNRKLAQQQSDRQFIDSEMNRRASGAQQSQLLKAQLATQSPARPGALQEAGERLRGSPTRGYTDTNGVRTFRAIQPGQEESPTAVSTYTDSQGRTIVGKPKQDEEVQQTTTVTDDPFLLIRQQDRVGNHSSILRMPDGSYRRFTKSAADDIMGRPGQEELLQSAPSVPVPPNVQTAFQMLDAFTDILPAEQVNALRALGASGVKPTDFWNHIQKALPERAKNTVAAKEIQQLSMLKDQVSQILNTTDAATQASWARRKLGLGKDPYGGVMDDAGVVTQLNDYLRMLDAEIEGAAKQVADEATRPPPGVAVADVLVPGAGGKLPQFNSPDEVLASGLPSGAPFLLPDGTIGYVP